MGYWKSKVLPRIKKAFDTNSGTSKKAAAAEACKEFDESKEKMNKELEDNKQELQPKVVEIYEACTAEIKAVVKAPSAASMKKHSNHVNKLLEDLAQIDFPGCKKAREASAKYGLALVSSSVVFVFEKVATFLPAEPAPEEAPVVTEESQKEPPKEQEEEGKKEKEEEKTPAACPTETPATVVEVKKDEVGPAEEKKEVEQTPPPPPAAKEEAPASEAPAPETAAKPAEGGKP